MYGYIPLYSTAIPELLFATMAKGGTVFYHIGITLLKNFISFDLVIGIGLLVTVLLGWNESVAKVLKAYLAVLYSLPKSAFTCFYCLARE